METAASFAAREYDFVIIGGGTAGLVLAARLSEDENITVGVLEAGKDRSEDPRILTPGFCGTLSGDPEYDWKFLTTPQKSVNGRQIAWPRGRVLGGSSAMNFMQMTFPSAAEIDAWEALGNAGWSWKDLRPYYRRSQSYVKPTGDVSSLSGTDQYDHSSYGETGPVKLSFYKSDSGLAQAWFKALESQGLQMKEDPLSGTAIGAFRNLSSVDPTSMTRSYSTSAYYHPNSGRSNLHVLTEALVQKINFDSLPSDTGLFTANQVAFVHNDTEYVVKARREVIVSAGTIQSPQILELSGIGSREILSSQNIKVLVGNPSVGENLQDHALVALCYEVADSFSSLDALRDPELLNQAISSYSNDKAGPLASGVEAVAFVPLPQTSEEDKIKDDETHEHLMPGVSEQHVLLQQTLHSSTEATSQLMLLPFQVHADQAHDQQELFKPSSPGSYLGLTAHVARPFSRGSVHIQSSNPREHPVVDPRYLSNPIDLEILLRQVQNLQNIAKTTPLASQLLDGGRTIPANLSQLQSEDELKNLVKEYLTTQYHPIGTCAMMPQGKGGVVDSRLKVYGTSNVRVIDASVFPLHTRGNIQSTVYAVAEYGSDIIKHDLKL